MAAEPSDDLVCLTCGAADASPSVISELRAEIAIMQAERDRLQEDLDDARSGWEAAVSVVHDMDAKKAAAQNAVVRVDVAPPCNGTCKEARAALDRSVYVLFVYSDAPARLCVDDEWGLDVIFCWCGGRLVASP